MRFNILESIIRQEEYAKKGEHPHFAPKNGNCWYCKGNIYSPEITEMGGNKIISGYSVEIAGNKLITGCPHCKKSYVD